MKYLFLLITLFSLQNIYAQAKTTFDSTSVRPIVLNYADSIRSGEAATMRWYYSSQAHGFVKTNNGLSGSVAEQFKIYQRMYKVTTQEEWLSLLNHRFPEIRYYAFISLMTYDMNNLELIYHFIDDNHLLMIQSGCSVDGGKMNDLVINKVWSQLNHSEKVTVIKLCIEKVDKNGVYKILGQLERIPETYSLLRKTVIENPYPTIVASLFKYKSIKDEAILRTALEKMYGDTLAKKTLSAELVGAMNNYIPRKSFKPILDKMMEDYLSKKLQVNSSLFLKLYANYRDKWAEKHLMHILTLQGQSISTRVYHAIETHQIDIYADLFFNLWANYGLYNDAYKMLYRVDKNRTIALMDTSFAQLNPKKYVNTKYLAIFLCYLSIEKGFDWKYEQVNTFLNSDNPKLYQIAMFVPRQTGNQPKLADLYIEQLYKFPKYNILSLIEAVNYLDFYGEKKMAIVEWYENNQPYIDLNYPHVKQYLIRKEIISK